ncbi:MAG: hypothetical protein PGN13_05580 [Patulibacter minatonensis]
MRPSPKQIRAWLTTEPSLTELRERYPLEWGTVEREMGAVLDTEDRNELMAYAQRVASGAATPASARAATPGLEPRVAAAIRQRMAAEAIKTLSLRAATGVSSGSVRFGDRQGKAIQGLLFEGGLTRKPVNLRKFRLMWPLLSERRKLMPLVQPQGIYCFYSDALVRELASLIGGRDCLEIAAGDGTLSRFLRARGVTVHATDDHSWKDVTFPEDVEHLDAVAALRARAPQVVLCSWPPAANGFEAEVFRTASVELYVVIGNRQFSGWGDHAAYAEQQGFTLRVDERLASLVLPPELESVVYVFERSAGVADSEQSPGEATST